MAQIEQKRIAALDDINYDDDIVTELIKSSGEAKKWAIAVDYTIPDTATEPVDQGTKRIGVDRIGLLTTMRTVPQSMLPHQMDDIKKGTMSRDGSKWTFTTTDDNEKYVCPGPPESGELRPDISTIYMDVSDPDGDGNNIYTQYRYVPDDNASAGTADETGSFVPIPSDLIMVNGQGTVVTDDNVNYTRKVDIAIGEPIEEQVHANEEKSLLFNSGKLVHAKTGVTPGTYPGNNPGTPGFGSEFHIAAFTVNRTGHITNAVTHNLYMPKTPASTTTNETIPGLVKIGDNIRPIGAQLDAGHTSPDTSAAVPYVAVAAADHVHTAAKLRLLHTNASPSTLEYNGSADVQYDFDNILKVSLPANPPSSSDQFLVSVNGAAVWSDSTSAIHPEYAMIDVAPGSYGTSLTGVSMNTSTKSCGGSMDASQTSFSGLKEGKAYVVCYYFTFEHTTARPMLEDVVVEVDTGSSSTPTTRATTASHVIDGSITGMPNYINGSMIFVVPSTHSYARLALKTGGSTWTVTGNIQIAEVK